MENKHTLRAGKLAWAPTGPEQPCLGSGLLYRAVRSLVLLRELFMQGESGVRSWEVVQPAQVGSASGELASGA